MLRQVIPFKFLIVKVFGFITLCRKKAKMHFVQLLNFKQQNLINERKLSFFSKPNNHRVSERKTEKNIDFWTQISSANLKQKTIFDAWRR